MYHKTEQNQIKQNQISRQCIFLNFYNLLRYFTRIVYSIIKEWFHIRFDYEVNFRNFCLLELWARKKLSCIQ